MYLLMKSVFLLIISALLCSCSNVENSHNNDIDKVTIVETIDLSTAIPNTPSPIAIVSTIAPEPIIQQGLGIKLDDVKRVYEGYGFVFHSRLTKEGEVSVIGEKYAAVISLWARPTELIYAEYSLHLSEFNSFEDIENVPGLGQLAWVIYGDIAYDQLISPWISDINRKSDFYCFDGYLIHIFEHEEADVIGISIMPEQDWPGIEGGCN